MINIDKFKAVNDKYGHPVGDKGIKKVADTISTQLNENDLFGRLGGEEFAIITISDNQNKVLQQVEAIRTAVAGEVVIIDETHEVTCTISCGVSNKTAQCVP